MSKVALWLGLAMSVSGFATGQQNRVVMGPGFEKGQTSSASLSYAAPEGWVPDAAAQKESGLMAVLVPKGETLSTADRAITVAFQRKDARDPAMADLGGFFRADMEETVTRFPDVQAERWQPAGLDARSVPFMSIELFGKQKNQPPPQRVLIVDSGDGFFSLVVTVSRRADLALPELERFFDSVRIEK